MVKIYLVRHGEATEGWTSQDPPLSELGKSQAESLVTFVTVSYTHLTLPTKA